MERTVTTAIAAEIISIGYEGLRSYLKRGLLGSSGLLLPFVDQDSPAPDLSRARAKWKRFGLVDLCLMRLAKQLIGLGLSFEQANDIASRDDIRTVFTQKPRAVGVTLMTWPPHFDFIVFARADLPHIPARLAEIGDVAILVQLDRIAEYVHSEFDRISAQQFKLAAE